jgi:hypothetical protein
MHASFLELYEKLLVAIPQRVQQAHIRSTSYGLFIYYTDGTTDEPSIYLNIPTVGAREWAFKRYGHAASFMIWTPEQSFYAIHEEVTQLQFLDSSVSTLVRRCYDHVFDPSTPEHVTDSRWRQFRTCLCNAAMSLNRLNWQDVLTTSDDFVVMACNWHSSDELIDNAKACIPRSTLRSLWSRRLLFYRETHEDKRAHAVLRDTIMRDVGLLSETSLIAFWTKAIESLIDETPSVLVDNGWNESVALAECLRIGKETILPMLTLCDRLDIVPKDGSLRSASADDILRNIGDCIRNIGYADGTIERRLRYLLNLSCRRNLGNPRWTIAPFVYAGILASLFAGYARPSYETYTHILSNWDTWTTAQYANDK